MTCLPSIAATRIYTSEAYMLYLERWNILSSKIKVTARHLGLQSKRSRNTRKSYTKWDHLSTYQYSD